MRIRLPKVSKLPRGIATPLRLLWAAGRGWSQNEVPRLGVSLAYYTLFPTPASFATSSNSSTS
jgi:hypothetical protein